MQFGKNFFEKIGEFSNLTIIDVHCNKNISELPNDFSNLSKLEQLNLSSTSISSLKNIENLENLSVLNLESVVSLSENGFYKNEDETNGSCNNLQILASLYNKKLKKLYLEGTNITDFSLIKNLDWTKKSGF